MKISDENVKSRQYEPTKAYIIGLSNISKGKKRGVGTLLYLLKKSLVCKTPIVKVDRNKNEMRH